MSLRRRPNRKAASLSPATIESAPPSAQHTGQVTVLGLALFMMVLWCWSASTAGIRSAELALIRGDYLEALELAGKELQSNHSSGRALTVAASACLALKDSAAATTYLKRVLQCERKWVAD